jgi:hypothetical protein
VGPCVWQRGKWNELRARIDGSPPHLQTWIKGKKIMDFTDKEKRHPDTGSIVLQVYGGGDFTKQFVRCQEIRMR